MLELNNEYGPLGEAVWERLLCMIYQSKEGYYYKFKSIDNVGLMLVKSIGSKWISKEKAIEIIRYLSESELLCKYLVSDGVMTSIGIQKRWHSAMVAMKRKCCVGKEYWLLNDILLNDEKNTISSEETIFSYEVIDVTCEVSTQKERKEKEIKVNESIEKKTNELDICLSDFNEILLIYYETFKKILQHKELSKLFTLIENYGFEWTCNAIREAVIKEKEYIWYVEGILKNLEKEGVI